MDKIQFLILAFLLSFMISCGQQKRYISYKVDKGESIRDVAKKFNLKTKELLRLNPDVSRRPPENTVIIIPNPKFRKASSATEDNKTPEETTLVTAPETEKEETTELVEKDTIMVEKVSTHYQTHTVEKGQTVYAITKLFDISKEELMALNPEYPDLKDNKLSIGQVLKVKKTETITRIPFEEDLKNYLTHTVKPKETVYSLTRFYNISKHELVALNPHLPDLITNQLQIGNVLKIRPIKNLEFKEEIQFYHDTIAIERPLKATFLLPFKAEEYSSVNAKDIFDNNTLANMVTDFYMGAEIAIDSLRQQGIEIETKVFDTGNRGRFTKQIISENDLSDEDVIIGPFYSDKATAITGKIKSPLIFPHFSSNQNTFSSSKLVKSTPDQSSYVTKLISYLKSNYTNETVFVVGDGSEQSNKIVGSLIENLKQHDSISTIHVLKPENGYIKKERFTSKMKPKTHSWVILTSTDNVAVADVLNSMVVLPEDVTAQVFAINKGDAYDEVDSNKLARVHFTYVTNHFVDDNDALTKKFTQKFKKKNFTIPSEYALKGFDVTYDVLMRLASDKKLSKTFKEGMSIRLANKFNYDSKLFSATDNYGLFIVKYNPDLSLKRLE